MKTTETATDGTLTIFSDIRGESFKANKIQIIKGDAYYCGMPVTALKQTDTHLSKFYYSVESLGTHLGTIALNTEDVKAIKSYFVPVPIDFTRVNSDVNGNPRFVCHFSEFINEGDRIKANHSRSDHFGISTQYILALNKARTIGGRKFHNKQYGGGIVFQMYSGDKEMSARIRELKEVNTNFLKEWSAKDFTKVKRAIWAHFSVSKYTYIDDHSAPAKPLQVWNYEQLDSLLGLAYTSSGDYAGEWVCNGVYLMAIDTHHCTGSMINEKGQVVASVEDENENTIFIEL